MSGTTQDWFYATHAGGRHGPVSTGQVADLLRSGAVTADTLVWSASLSNWLPLVQTELRALIPAAPPPMPPPYPQPAQQFTAPPYVAVPTRQYREYNTNGLSSRVAEFFGGMAGLTAAVAGTMFFSSREAAYGLVQADVMQNKLIFVQNFIGLICLVIYFIWTYRQMSNVLAKTGPAPFTPASAVWMQFIPILWFYKPYQILKLMGDRLGRDPSLAGLALMSVMALWASVAVTMFQSFVVDVEPGTIAPAAVQAQVVNLAIGSAVLDVISSVLFIAFVKKLQAAMIANGLHPADK